MMPTKALLTKLDPDTRAFALVGAYMGFFALLEAAINDAIGQLLGVDHIRRTIVMRNMSFGEKIQTLRVLVDFFVSDTEAKGEFDALAKVAIKIGATRNVVAHTPFRASRVSDGVDFLVVRAKSKLELPSMDWPIEVFMEKVFEISATDNALRGVEAQMVVERGADALRKANLGSVAAALVSSGGGLVEALALMQPAAEE